MMIGLGVTELIIILLVLLLLLAPIVIIMALIYIIYKIATKDKTPHQDEK
ncbi:hypothetical protein C7391_1354 [Methanimicrococcus blatticola]|uniref:Uncharacterized protein n=1 Tax=Methanimicrococcus blatticola TaxID=91560 RepID=A0A484F2F0_9EURY|nr:hypothetical protein C7391_1354 [Methanimicrococcus blatticola]